MKSKRIGIITIQRCNNFGADLQAYALGAKLRSMGYDAENIDYLFYKHPRHEKLVGEKPVLPISLVNRVKEFLFPIVEAIRGRKNRAALCARRERFEEWFSKHVKSGNEYRSVKSLYENPPTYDVYVVGSDQVWNPRMYSNIKPYFLDFVPRGAKCISYASSFGVSSLAGSVYYKYHQWLKRFSAIGVREKIGTDIISTMALGVEVKHVVDPTLLLTAEEWLEVGEEPENIGDVPYLLLYDLIRSEETVALAKCWAEAKGWRVVRIGDGAYGPGEFVWLFAHAAAVVTNSFHGSVFSDGTDEQLQDLLKIPGVRRVFYGNALADIIAMSHCGFLIGSDSTFSGWGAYLGQVPGVYPHLHYSDGGVMLEDASSVCISGVADFPDDMLRFLV